MALTPEEVVNQKFTITKFRDGYDLDQVDDFLDKHSMVYICEMNTDAPMAMWAGSIRQPCRMALPEPVMAPSLHGD